MLFLLCVFYAFRVLQNVTGYDIRVRKLEPHVEKNQVDNSAYVSTINKTTVNLLLRNLINCWNRFRRCPLDALVVFYNLQEF